MTRHIIGAPLALFALLATSSCFDVTDFPELADPSGGAPQGGNSSPGAGHSGSNAQGGTPRGATSSSAGGSASGNASGSASGDGNAAGSGSGPTTGLAGTTTGGARGGNPGVTPRGGASSPGGESSLGAEAGAGGVGGTSVDAGGAGGEGGSSGGGGQTEVPTDCGPELRVCSPVTWPGGRIPYRLEDRGSVERYGSWNGVLEDSEGQSHSGPADQQAIFSAMDEWSLATRDFIRFVPADNGDVRYLSISNEWDVGCGSLPGAASSVTVLRVRGCDAAEIRHALGHVIGLSHQHQRMDRDRYLQVDPGSYCAPPKPTVDECTETSSADPSASSKDGFCGLGSYAAYRHQLFADNVPQCKDGNGSDYGPFDFSSIMLNGAAPPNHGCAADRPDLCGRVRRDGTFYARNERVSKGDASAVFQLYQEPSWTRLRPLWRSDPSPDQPLDLQLVEGVSVVGSPALARWGNVGVVAVARGTDGHFYAKFNVSGGVSWPTGDWRDLGGNYDSDPAAIAWGSEQLHFAGLTADGHVLVRHLNAGVLDALEEDIGRPEGELPSAPAMTSWGSDRLDVFVRSGLNYYQKTWTPEGWSGWRDVGGNFWSKPSVLTRSKGNIDVIGIGVGGDVWHKVMVNDAWLKDSWAFDLLLDDGKSVAVTSRGGDDLGFHLLTHDGLLWHGSSRVSPADWKPIGGLPEESPAAVTTAAGVTHSLIVVRANGVAGLWHRLQR